MLYVAQESSPTTATAQIKAGPPKFQSAVPFEVRQILDINDLDKDEIAYLEVTYELKTVKNKE